MEEQIEATVKSAVELARNRLPDGEGLTHYEECDDAIPEPRRNAMPGVRYCVRCQAELEKNREKTVSFYNRRGNKDNQLK